MTAPHIGNTGVNDEDTESAGSGSPASSSATPPARAVQLAGAAAASTTSCVAQGVVGISGIDTRALTRHLRERGAMRVGIEQRSAPTVDDAARPGARGARA